MKEVRPQLSIKTPENSNRLRHSGSVCVNRAGEPTFLGSNLQVSKFEVPVVTTKHVRLIPVPKPEPDSKPKTGTGSGTGLGSGFETGTGLKPEPVPNPKTGTGSKID